jgi:hypothetical protein
MSLLVTAGVVAGGVLFGRLVGRVLWGKRQPENGPAAAGSENGPDRHPPRPAQTQEPVKPASGRDPLAEFPCQLGDVVIGAAGEEAWLAGVLIFSERVPTAALFVAPDAGADRALYVRPNPAPTLVWMMPVAESELSIGREPPSTLEHKGERFERVRRLPLHVERAGTGAPDIGDQAVVADYASAAGERLLVVIGSGPARAWRGMTLEPGMYDVLPSGKATLDA